MSTVWYADEMLVVDEERVLERGTHEQLVALGGRYAHYFAKREAMSEAQ